MRFRKRGTMNSKVTSLKNSIRDFMVRHGISGEMEQNLLKEAIHLHLLSALSDAGILRHVVFQGGTALRLCYGGERYSEDLDFACGKSGAYLDKIEFEKLIQRALETAKRSLQRDFGISSDQIALKPPPRPWAIKETPVAVAAWQIAVPIDPTPRSPKSRIKIEFANVPSYDNKPGRKGHAWTRANPRRDLGRRKRERNTCRQGGRAGGQRSAEISRCLGCLVSCKQLGCACRSEPSTSAQ